ncbi:MAG: PAS domain-containing protein [Pseudomonadota bacterium]
MTPGNLLEQWLDERLFEVVPSAIAVIDSDWRVVKANRAFEERFGEWRGRRCYEVYKGQKRHCRRCLASRSFVDGKVRSRHEVGVDRKGRLAHYLVHIAPVSQPDGKVPYLVEISTDITRQCQLSDELDRANTLNRTLIEAFGDAVVALDPAGRVMRWNPAAGSLFGWSAAELLGRQPPDGLLPAGFGEAIDRGESFLLAEAAAKGKDGNAIPVDVHGVPLTNGSERLGSAAFLRDLREIKQLEREKLDAERLAAVGQTVAGLAHGVKNILTGLEGGLYLMSTGLEKDNDARVREGFGMLRRNIGRVAAFVRTLLDFSRGRTPVVQLVDPGDLVREVVALYRDAALQEGIVLAVDVREGAGPAPLDAEGIHTCLANLVTNAIDACRMSDNEQRTICVRALEELELIPARRNPGTPATVLVFEVRDNGAGMEYEVKQKVFTNFFTTKGEGGTGMGLLVTRKLVYEHGGSIEVESEPGNGTCFRLKFPRRRLPPVVQ